YVNQGLLTISNPQALGGPGIAGVQTFTLTGPTVGSTKFTLAFPDGPGGTLYTTPALTYTGVAANDATAIQTALTNLKSIGGAGAVVAVTSVSATQFKITFNGNFIGFNQPNLQPNVTAGTGSAAVLTQTYGAGGTVVANGAQMQLQGGIDVQGE